MSQRATPNSQPSGADQATHSARRSSDATGAQPRNTLDGYRLDAAHAAPGGNGPHMHIPGAEGMSAPPLDGSKSIAASERELQLQARQISQHLRSQFAELDRREKNLTEQLSALDQEQRAARLHLQQLEDELLGREASLRGKEMELEQRLRKCEQLVAHLDEKQDELDAEWERLEQQQTSYREEVKRELLQNWNALDGRPEPHANSNLAANSVQPSEVDPDRLAEQVAAVESELRAELEAEMESRRASWEREREIEQQNWQIQKEAEYAEIERERSLTAEATRRAQDQLEELRAAQQTEFDALREKNQLTLEERQRELKEEFQTERDVYATHLEEARLQIHELQTKLQQTELQLNSQASRNRVLEAQVEQSKLDTASNQNTQKEELDASILAVEQEYEQELKAKEAEWEQNLTASFEEQLSEQKKIWQEKQEEAQADLKAELEEQTARSQRLDEELNELRQQYTELKLELETRPASASDSAAAGGNVANQQEELQQLRKEQTMAEQRLRFREDHLHKMREELEQQQKELKLTHQKIAAEKQDLTRNHDLQSQQLKRYRGILEKREESLERERKTLTEIREFLEGDVNKEKAQLDTERADWEAQRAADRDDLQRQADWLKSETKSLQDRKTRLDELRAELEDKHQRNLELQLAVEQIRVEINDQLGEDEAERRIEEARSQLAELLEAERDEINHLRDELTADIQNLEQNREAFQNEKFKLLASLEQQRDELNNRQDELKDELDNLKSREQAWSKVREGWTGEKLEAESVIRSLLQQLSDQHGSSEATAAEEETEDSESLPTISVEDLRKSIKIQRPA